MSHKFTDSSGKNCSIRFSSAAICYVGEEEVEGPFIWFGITKATPMQVFPGGRVEKLEGDFLGEEMHLSQEQVAELLPYLQRFAETGDLMPKADEAIRLEHAEMKEEVRTLREGLSYSQEKLSQFESKHVDILFTSQPSVAAEEEYWRLEYNYNTMKDYLNINRKDLSVDQIAAFELNIAKSKADMDAFEKKNAKLLDIYYHDDE